MRIRRYLWLILGVVLIDQAVKMTVKLNMYPEESWPIIDGFFRLWFVENEGFAFGMTFADLLSRVGVVITSYTAKFWLSMISLLALAALFVSLWKFARHRSPLPWFLALVLGGAIGNVIDRLFYGWWFSSINTYHGGFMHGRVVDMFCLDTKLDLFPAPIFNLADVAISVGVITLLVFQGRFQRQHRQRVAASLSDDLSPEMTDAGVAPESSSAS